MNPSSVSVANDHTFAPTRSVRDGLRDYLLENSFTEADYTQPTFRLKVLGKNIDVPNGPNRQWAIPIHDLHHVATGYGTDFVGEGEIAVWELRGGCRTPVVYFLNLVAAAIGTLLAPRRIWAAFCASKSARAIYRSDLNRERILEMPIGTLREHLGIPTEGLARGERRLHADAEARRARNPATVHS